MNKKEISEIKKQLTPATATLPEFVDAMWMLKRIKKQTERSIPFPFGGRNVQIF